VGHTVILTRSLFSDIKVWLDFPDIQRRI
jgi:hypothetical protein